MLIQNNRKGFKKKKTKKEGTQFSHIKKKKKSCVTRSPADRYHCANELEIGYNYVVKSSHYREIKARNATKILKRRGTCNLE